MSWLSKGAEAIASPAAVAIACLGIVLALLLMRRVTVALITMMMTVVVLWLVTTPAFEIFATRALESRYATLPLAETPVSDVIILLSGGYLPNPQTLQDPAHPDDRLLHAYALYKTGKAPLIIVSGGNRDLHPGERLDSDLMKGLLLKLGVPEQSILEDDSSRTTEENARNSSTLLQKNSLTSVLLVTSAFHMPRAMAAFERVGLSPTPSPADFSTDDEWRWQSWLSESRAVWHQSLVLHELVGLVYYAIRGWG